MQWPRTSWIIDYPTRLDGGVMLIFSMYNVLSAGGYLAKKIGREVFYTLRVLKVYNRLFSRLCHNMIKGSKWRVFCFESYNPFE